jgi:hypothetical protein
VGEDRGSKEMDGCPLTDVFFLGLRREGNAMTSLLFGAKMLL